MHFQDFVLPMDKNHKAGSLNDYTVGGGLVPGMQIITKYATNEDVDGAEDIWNGGGEYTGFPTTTVETLSVLSSNAADNIAGTGAQKVRVFYHDDTYDIYDKDENFLFVDIDLDGVTPVDSGVDVRRVWRAQVIQSGSGESNAGTITGRWTTTTAVVFFVMPAGESQTAIGNFTVPLGYRAYLKSYHFSMDNNTTKSSEVRFHIRDFGANTIRKMLHGRVTTEKDYKHFFAGGIMLDEKTDIVASVASVSSVDSIVHCVYELLLIKNT